MDENKKCLSTEKKRKVEKYCSHYGLAKTDALEVCQDLLSWTFEFNSGLDEHTLCEVAKAIEERL